MMRSPFRRAHRREASLPLAEGVLPIGVEAAIDVALDPGARTDARLAALARLEHTSAPHRERVARSLVPVLSAPPDVAARAHVVLLVLAPRLALARDADGGFIASARSIDDAHDDGIAQVDPTLGRVVGLDALASLFGAQEEAPLFLSAAPRQAPAPYRPSAEVLARRDEELRRDAARAARRARLRELGLDEDDLFDDAAEHLPSARRHVPRRGAAVQIEVEEPLELVLETRTSRVSLGIASVGAWWSDVRVGDHKGAQRLWMRLAREHPFDDVRAQRLPTLAAPGGVVALVFGRDRIEHVVGAEQVVAFLEREGPHLVGVSLTWRNRGHVRPLAR
jgi:hypothetical protein